MSQNGEYGDNLTLQALARELNLQFLIISANGLMHCKIISNDGKFDKGLNLLCLGYFPEGQGEHYVSIDIHPQTKEYIIENIETHNENELLNGRVDDLREYSFQQKEKGTFSACNISVYEDSSSPIESDESCDNDVGEWEDQTHSTCNSIPYSVDECSKGLLLDSNSPPPVSYEYKSPFPRESYESCDNDVDGLEEETPSTSNCIPSTVDECSKDLLPDPNSPPPVSDEYNSPFPRESDKSCDNLVDRLEKETPSTCKRYPTTVVECNEDMLPGGNNQRHVSDTAHLLNCQKKYGGEYFTLFWRGNLVIGFVLGMLTHYSVPSLTTHHVQWCTFTCKCASNNKTCRF